ncbi:hypothetical protein CRUP_005447, partial [Coryphaenoides rupestris]
MEGEREREERKMEEEREREERKMEEEREREERKMEEEREKEARRTEVQKISQLYHQEAQRSLSFLYCLYERLLLGSAPPQCILGNITWAELCDVITQQVDRLTLDLSNANDKRLSSLTSDLREAQGVLAGERVAGAGLRAAGEGLAVVLLEHRRRCSSLRLQKEVLLLRARRGEAWQEEAWQLASALGGEEEEEKEEQGRGRGLRRWRVCTCAILALNRMVACAAAAACVNHQLVDTMIDKATPPSPSLGPSHQELESAAHCSVSRLLEALLHQSEEVGHVTGTNQPSLASRLGRGLARLHASPQQSGRRHFLLFSQRLHSAEVERRALRLEVANQKQDWLAGGSCDTAGHLHDDLAHTS